MSLVDLLALEWAECARVLAACQHLYVHVRNVLCVCVCACLCVCVCVCVYVCVCPNMCFTLKDITSMQESTHLLTIAILAWPCVGRKCFSR